MCLNHLLHHWPLPVPCLFRCKMCTWHVASHDLNPTLPKVYLQRDVCFTAFAVFDQDGDGRITLDELKQFLSEIRNFQVLSQRSGRTYGSFTGTVSSTVYSHVLYSPHMYKIDIFKIGATCALLKIITKTRGCVSLDKQVNISFAALLKKHAKRTI